MENKAHSKWSPSRIGRFEQRLSIKGKIRLLFAASLLLSIIIALPLLLSSTLSLNKKIQEQATQTVVTLFEETLAEQLTTINIIGISETLIYIREHTTINAYCLLNDHKIVVKSYNATCNSATLPFLIPIANAAKNTVGYFYSSTQASSRGIIYNEIKTAFSLILVFFTLSFILLWRLQSIITRPLQQLHLAISTFTKTQDFHIRVTPNSDDEIGQLALAFNQLLQDMRTKEHELIKAKNEADTANKLKGDFLASVSHEIRTPMNGIIGTAELLLESLDNKKHKNYTSTILRSSESLLTIINDILDFSKIESGKLDIEAIEFNLYSEVEDVADLMAIKAEEKDLEVILAISPYTPEYVIGDPNRLRQVITNLVNNAIKFTENGHILIEVEPQGCSLNNTQTEQLRFSIIDTGIGIAPESQKKIFERFTQAQSSITRQYGGTGLGLAICKQLIELQGGEITVESIEHKGSTFSFYLDLAINTTQNRKSQNDKLDGIRVLVVDDNPYFLEHIKSALRFYGLIATCVRSAKDALNLLANHQVATLNFDLIIVDENMPGINGCSLAETITLSYVDLAPPIILLNNIGADVRHEQVYAKVGVMACMPKPIHLHQLITLIELTLSEYAEGNRQQLLNVDELYHNASSNTAATGLKFASPNILVAEANDLHYQFMASLLENAGCRVIRTKNTEATVKYALGHRIDLMIADNDLESSGGASLYDTLAGMHTRNNYQAPPIILTCQQGISEAQIQNTVSTLLHKQQIKNQLLPKMATLLPNYVIDPKNGWVQFANTRVLLVEDNRINAQITTEILLDFNCELIHCADGQLAFEEFQKQDFDVVLMDCQMPIMDGFESTACIRMFEKNNYRTPTPIIALTANAMKGDNERCYRAGMDDYITKPIKRDKLRTVLMHYIDHKKIIVTSDSANIINNELTNEEHFIHVLEFCNKANIHVQNYILDIQKSIELLHANYLVQPPKFIADTAKTLLSICDALGLNRLHNTLHHVIKEAMHQHIEKLDHPEALAPLLEACLRTIHKTSHHVANLIQNSGSALPLIEVEPIAPPTTTKTSNVLKNIAVPYATAESPVKNFSATQNISHQLVDESVFNAAKSIFKRKLPTVIAEYLEDTTTYFDAITQSISENNLNKIRENAHPLKSSSYTLGFMHIGDCAKKIELIAKTHGPIESIEKELPTLTVAIEETTRYLRPMVQI